MHVLKDTEMIRLLSEETDKAATKTLRLVILSGKHYSILKNPDIASLLPEKTEFLPGPGCPLCIMSGEYIDRLIAYSKMEGLIITVFEELLNIPGSGSTLQTEKERGADIRVVATLMDALMVAKKNRRKKVVFPATGFENTAALTAAAIIQARMAGLRNFYVSESLKRALPAMVTLLQQAPPIDGFIIPEETGTITGVKEYRQVPLKHGTGIVISGDNLIDLMQSILMLAYQNRNEHPAIEIECTKSVHPQGNLKAKQLIEEVFSYTDGWWPGLGVIAGSRLKVRESYIMHVAEENINLNREPVQKPKKCICGEIFALKNTPEACPMFGTICTPSSPSGACMATTQGPCYITFKYIK